MQQLLLGIPKALVSSNSDGTFCLYHSTCLFSLSKQTASLCLVVGIFQWLFLQIASIHQSGHKWLALNHSLTRIRNEVTVLISESFESFTQQIHSKTLIHSGMKQVTALIVSHLNYLLNNIVKNH